MKGGNFLKNNEIWKNNHITIQDDPLYDDVENFFNELEGSKILEYREGQHTMALDIVDTIRDKQILLIEAEVGIGKSYAYLIPLIYSMKDNKDFKGFIIATSTIALQEQLLKDVEKVSSMLGMDNIKVTLAKGKNNYLCRKRLEEFLVYSDNKKYQYILDEVIKNDLYDRNDFDGISEKVWKSINVKNCTLHNCPYYNDCKFTLKRENFEKEKQIIITNQALLTQHLKSNQSIFSDTDMIIIDEAHNLENNVREAYRTTIDKRKIEGTMYHLYGSVTSQNEDCIPDSAFFDSLNEFFSKLRNSAKSVMRKNDLEENSYNDYNRVPFICGPSLQNTIYNLIQSIQDAIIIVENKDIMNGYHSINKTSLETLHDFMSILKDLLQAKNSKNIYWVDFLDADGKYVQLSYTPKKIDELTAQLLSKVDTGVVLTSATLTTGNDNYQYYANSIGLDNIVGKSVLKEFPITSPYDYENNTLLYCPNDISNPNNREAYLRDLTQRIRKLLEITDGRSLVLFTSKQDMNYVYEQMNSLDLDIPLLVQKGGISNKKLKERFEQDVRSCLFATGTFYEGIDIKGSSLSSVIIARLPFPIVDPVMEEKASLYKDGFQNVYLPEMLLKLKQGAGRLIRSSTDKGVVSILDSRFLEYDAKYEHMLTASLPFTNITSELDDVKKFVNEKLR